MSDDLIAIIGCSILGLMAHGAKRHAWLEWVLRVTICLFLFGELISLLDNPAAMADSPWGYYILLGTVVSSGLLLIKPGRVLFSYLFTIVNQIIAGRFLVAAFGRLHESVPAPSPATGPLITPSESSPSTENSGSDSASSSAGSPANADAAASSTATAVPPAPVAAPLYNKVSFLRSFVAERIFVPESIPHMNGLWIYITTLAFLLTHMEITGFQMPSIMIPVPVTLDQLFSYNFLGLILLAVCGAGIFISRKPLEVLRRLGLVKPKLWQVGVGIAGIFMTFAYDWLWSYYTHGQEGLGYADKLSHYNEGTFVGGASAGAAAGVASATGICAGFGEEILIRGALQPVFGIIPAAFMHGVLHGQFAHAPLLIVQVFGWSALMGIIRRYTNTTTTIITHVGFNFVSTFIIAFNP